METDVLIIGSGIAGLSLAIKLNDGHPDLHITIISKSEADDCNTRYAQGGVAAVTNLRNDSFNNHIHDTLACGKGLCSSAIVKMVVEQAPARINDLVQLGVKFDYQDHKHFHLALEGGHSLPRVVHHKDKTGFEIESVLLKQVQARSRIQLLTNTTVIDLLTENINHKKTCTGIKILDTKSNQIISLRSHVTVLASGGCGQVYANTTNPRVASGDGYAMAFRAGAVIKNMRFMQFHPTSLYQAANHHVSFLISEALRGFGAHVVDGNEKRFLFLYDNRGELATRDVISNAIYDYMQTKGLSFVYLDLRHLDIKSAKNHFPQIFAEFKRANLNPKYDLIPITPSAHYQCGGVAVDQDGLTSIQQLYALGEVSYTGLHGANRLASNSLLEALVFAHNAAEKINSESFINKASHQKTESIDIQIFEKKGIKELIFQLKKTMTKTAFENDYEELLKARTLSTDILTMIEQEIANMKFSQELLLLRNLSQTANLILNDKIENFKTADKEIQSIHF